MDRFSENEGVHRANMVTQIGLMRYLSKEDRHKKLHHIMIPDMNMLLSEGSSSGETITRSFMALNYDAVSNYHTLYLSQLHVDRPIIVGIATSITPGVLKKHRAKWVETGFLRRFLPISYAYTAEQAEGVRELCLRGLNIKPPPIPLDYEFWDQEITPRYNHTKTLLGVINGIVQNQDFRGESSMGITPAEMFHTLVLSHARQRRSPEADGSDVAALIRLSKYINYDMLPLPTLTSKALDE